MVKSKSYRGPERRKHPRFRYPLCISYKKNGKKFEEELLEPSAPSYFTAKDGKLSVARDISGGGIRFVTKGKFLPGVRLFMKIWSPTVHHPLIGLAEVIWQKKRSLAGGYLTGVAFASLGDKKELKKLLDIFTDLEIEKMIEK